MTNNLRVILFVVILGAFTSVLLLSADNFTEDRIQANEEARFKIAVLDAHGISHNPNNVHDVFAEKIEINENDDYIYYVNKETGNVTINFRGGGVWGPIIGLLTLESDRETISYISILQQEETPGLGGVVAERNYLDNYVGKKLVPELRILKSGASGENEVDSITGATRTSEAFESILNEAYTTFLSEVESAGE
ncbi:MAG: FMN-binding protein [Candidatus Izimaplasma sp.]|nr:FMN-binding protein [Candidatus Izimaplasma bacterium]